jgi:hypothetical protein
MAWAAAHGQGAPAAVVERAAGRFLGRPDVHRAPDPAEARFATSDLLAHEEAIVRGARARRGEGSGRLDGALVDAVLTNAPVAPTGEQAAVLRGVTSSGHGVDSVEALAGTGKTFAAGLLARAYAAGGFRVLGTAPTARAVRELTEEAGSPWRGRSRAWRSISTPTRAASEPGRPCSSWTRRAWRALARRHASWRTPTLRGSRSSRSATRASCQASRPADGWDR